MLHRNKSGIKVNMVETNENISPTTIIGSECRESFIPLDFPGAAPLAERGVVMSGLSRLCPPYEIARCDPEFHLLIYTVKGRATLYHDTETTHIEPNELRLASAHTPYRYILDEPYWEIMWFHLADIDRWRHLRDKTSQPLFVGQSSQMPSIMEALISESHSSQPDRVAMGLHFAAILGIYLDRSLAAGEDPATAHTRQKLATLWFQVDANLAFPWDVKRMADELHVSETHFHRLVRRHNHTTPLRMVRQLRMHRAEELLKHTDYTLSLIAERLGYQTPFALSKAFKQHAGCSPRMFRI